MPPLSAEKILVLINSFYQSAQENSPTLWQQSFSQFCNLLSSGPGSMGLYSPKEQKYFHFVSLPDQTYFEEYSTFFRFVSQFLKPFQKMNGGIRFNRAEYCSDTEFRQTELYQKHLRYKNIFHFEYRILFNENGLVAGVLFSRPEKMKNFGASEKRLIDAALPHLQRAFQIHLKFAQAWRKKAILFECFERLSQGIIILDNSRKIIFANQTARRFTDAGNGLLVNHRGKLIAEFSRNSKELEAVLRSIFELPFDSQENFGRTLQISRHSNPRPLTVFVAPYFENEANVFGANKLAFMFVNDPEHEIGEVEPILISLYGLTPTEAKITAILAQGKSLSDACTMMNIKQNTIRTHLKRIFSKTDTRRQSELVKLIINDLGNVKFMRQKDYLPNPFG